MAEMVPFPRDSEPSLRDVLDRIEQTHGCLEDARSEIRATNRNVERLAEDVGGLKLQTAQIRGAQKQIAEGFGLKPEHEDAHAKVKRFFGGYSAFQVTVGLVSASTGAAFVAHVLWAAAPGLWAALAAGLHAFMSQH